MTLLGRALRALRARARLVLALYLVELGLSVVFMLTVWRTLAGELAHHPLFARGVAGSDAALILSLAPLSAALRALGWAGVGLLVAWTLASLYLGAGLLGALAGRPFVATANGRGLAFARLFLIALVPWAAGGIVLFIGVDSYGPELEDLAAAAHFGGRLLLGAAPGLAILLVTAVAVDQARAELVLGGAGALRALLRGYAVAFRRPAALACYVVYAIVLVALSAGYLLASAAAGVLALLLLRQAFAAARFLLRSTTSAAQVALQLDVIEVREIAKRAEPGGDVGVGQPAQAVEREVLDAE